MNVDFSSFVSAATRGHRRPIPPSPRSFRFSSRGICAGVPTGEVDFGTLIDVRLNESLLSSLGLNDQAVVVLWEGLPLVGEQLPEVAE